MRTLKIFAHISLDGVIQTSGEDDFPYADWTAPYRTPEGGDLVAAAQGDRFDLLLGRTTYDIWADYWPKAPSGLIADGINAATKYVATHHPESLAWGPREAVGPDIVKDVRRIKSQDGPPIIVWGSSTLTSKLFASELVDEMMLIIYPVFVGTGKRLFAEGTPGRTFELVSSKMMSPRLIVNNYRVAAPLK